MNQEKHGTLVFDAFGTLFDVTALGDLMSEHVQKADSVAVTWRAMQLQYSFIRTMTHAWVDFDQVTREALDRALALHGVTASERTRQELAGFWRTLPLHPDAATMLEATAGYTRAILSNGTFETITSLLRSGGVDQYFDVIISADSVGRFKPDQMVYTLAQAVLEVPADTVQFVTSNAFDVAGAKAAGFTVYWVNRTGLAFDSVGWEPDVTVRELAELSDQIQ